MRISARNTFLAAVNQIPGATARSLLEALHSMPSVLQFNLNAGTNHQPAVLVILYWYTNSNSYLKI